METSSKSNSNKQWFWIKFDFITIWITFLILIFLCFFVPGTSVLIDLVKMVGGAYCGAAGVQKYQSSRGQNS